MSGMTILPPGWPRPRGYANGMVASGRMLAIAGLIGWDATETLVGPDFAAQYRKTLENIAAVLDAAGAKPEHLISVTVYVTDTAEYIAAIKPVGEAWRAVFGKHYPAMALVQVAALLEPGAKVEIQGLACIPDPRP